MSQIFQPQVTPFYGNTGQVDPGNITKSFARLSKLYGPIVRLDLNGESDILIANHEYASGVFDEKLFTKRPAGAVIQLRNGVGNGLFTAFNEEEDWIVAHRILGPQFGPLAIRQMFPEMHEICCQLVSKWARQGPFAEIDPTVDFTKLTLDSIALCAMGTRFNSFLREELHPFPVAMTYFLTESGRRAMRPAFLNDYLYRSSNRKYWQSIDVMRNTAQDAIQERRDHPTDKSDLLNAMIHGRDPKTGASMSDKSVINNAITFLIAGHETTSGLLSFWIVLLLLNPSAMRSAREEVDRIIGNAAITVDHMSQLPYISASLRETLRLWPTAPIVRRVPRDDQDFPIRIGKEQYEINQNDVTVTNNFSVHRDSAIYDEPESFIPERMLDEKFNKLPAHSWQPFGVGPRSCIGRSFALQEATLAAAMLLQNFTFEACDSSYQMNYRSTLTIKPDGFKMRAILRSGLTPASLERRIWGGLSGEEDTKKDKESKEDPNVPKSPMTILYGSNSGTCESLAQSLANAASGHGYEPSVKAMDSGMEELSKEQPVVIITASYEGEPPDNACHFVDWVKNLKEASLKSSKFAVFGCGNHDWVNTFHKIPRLVDEGLAGAGASRIAEIGLCDVAEGHIFDDFDAWADQKFWPGVEEIYGAPESAQGSAGLDIDVESGARAVDLRSDVKEGIVLENKLLTAPGEPVKKHVKIQLPSGSSYDAGDYLAVLPVNPSSIVRRVMARFGLAWDARITISEGQHTFLPVGKPLPAHTLLSTYVELNSPCTKKNIRLLADHIEDKAKRSEVETLSLDEISEKRISVLDILEKYPECCVSFGDYLSLLGPLRVRQYSISSSPIESAETCSLTYSVLDEEAKIGGKRFLGAASNFLSHLAPDERIQVAVRPSHKAFHPPTEIESTPVIMVCAGTGLAPFHGFVEERAKQAEAGRKLARALLFIGCRDPEKDALYGDELTEWAKQGIVDVRYAFSRASDKSEGCKYVQDRLWRDRDDARALWRDGGRIFVCGNKDVGEAIREVFIKAILEEKGAMDDAEERANAEEFFDSIRNERFATDVFA